MEFTDSLPVLICDEIHRFCNGVGGVILKSTGPLGNGKFSSLFISFHFRFTNEYSKSLSDKRTANIDMRRPNLVVLHIDIGRFHIKLSKIYNI
jgi:hypothetical protein